MAEGTVLEKTINLGCLIDRSRTARALLEQCSRNFSGTARAVRSSTAMPPLKNEPSVGPVAIVVRIRTTRLRFALAFVAPASSRSIHRFDFDLGFHHFEVVIFLVSTAAIAGYRRLSPCGSVSTFPLNPRSGLQIQGCTRSAMNNYSTNAFALEAIFKKCFSFASFSSSRACDETSLPDQSNISTWQSLARKY